MASGSSAAASARFPTSPRRVRVQRGHLRPGRPRGRRCHQLPALRLQLRVRDHLHVSGTGAHDFHNATASLLRGYDLEDLGSVYPADAEQDVLGSPALLSGTQLLVGLGDAVLRVSVWLGEHPPADVDVLVQARGLAELVIPPLPEFRATLATPAPASPVEPMPEVSLCEAPHVGELNELDGLAFDDASGDPSSRAYSSCTSDAGLAVISVYRVEGVSLDDHSESMSDAEDRSVGGQPAISVGSQLTVELPGGRNVLDVSAFAEAVGEEPAMGAGELAAMVADRLLAAQGGE